jgi:hypothetical protein
MISSDKFCLKKALQILNGKVANDTSTLEMVQIGEFIWKTFFYFRKVFNGWHFWDDFILFYLKNQKNKINGHRSIFDSEIRTRIFLLNTNFYTLL